MKIELTTIIQAPIEVCFDLSRSIDLHLDSMKEYDEQAIGGIMNGLISLNETVTWQANHFGINFKMTCKVTQMTSPAFFVDEMIDGPFKSLKHQHIFESRGGYTHMMDIFEFQAPVGILGKCVEKLFLGKYLKKMLTHRNTKIKTLAEIEK